MLSIENYNAELQLEEESEIIDDARAMESAQANVSDRDEDKKSVSSEEDNSNRKLIFDEALLESSPEIRKMSL